MLTDIVSIDDGCQEPPSMVRVTSSPSVSPKLIGWQIMTTIVPCTPTQSHQAQVNYRRIVLVTAALLLYLAILHMTGSAVRNNDQIAYLSGATQLSRLQAAPWHTDFYNYDKQYGTYWLLATALRLAPGSDPILTGNIFQVFLFGLALVATVIRISRHSNPPLAFLTPILLCPAIIFSMPFMGTSTISLSFLLLAFLSMEYTHTRIGRDMSCLLVALSVMCRADAVLTVPALILAHIPRTHLFDLFKRPFFWALVASATMPLLIGRFLFTNTDTNAGLIRVSAGLMLDFRVWIGFIVFGLGLAAFSLMVILIVGYFTAAWSKKRWFAFYVLTAVSVLLPFGFYFFHLHSLQFFLPTVAVLLFVACSPRTTPIFLGMYRKPKWAYQAGLAVLCIVPWVVGLDAPSLSRVRPTFAHATEFPSSKGHWPMGAYLSYLYDVGENNFVLDHNEKIWLAAKSIDYQSCGTRVPLLYTPMVNYLEFAARLQGKDPILIKNLDQSPCGYVYADARSLMRLEKGVTIDFTPFDLLGNKISIASNADWSGQLILRADRGGSPSNIGIVLSQLRTHFDGREIEIHILPSLAIQHQMTIQSQLPFEYAIFAAPESSCRIEPSEPLGVSTRAFDDGLLLAWSSTDLLGPVYTRIECLSANLAGWAKTVLPRYMH